MLVGSTAIARAADPPKSILVFLPDDPTIPAMSAIANSFKAKVQTGWSGPVAFDFESLDIGWFTSPAYEEQLREFYRIKYEGYRPDAIVTLRFDVLRNLLALRRELWPDVPLTFIAEDRRAVPELPGEPDITGVWFQYELRETLELALRLFPATRRAAVVIGASPWERSLYPSIDEELAPLAGRVELIHMRGLPFEELARQLAALPEDAVVLFHTYYTDGDGQRFIGFQFFQRLKPSIRRPMLSVHGTVFGHGLVGGVMVSYERLGEDLAGIVLRQLRGEPAATMPVRAAASRLAAVDARELARFHVPARRIPPGVEVSFVEPSLWERYRWQVTGGAAALVLQAALISLLLVERRRRARATLEARRALDNLAHLNRVAAMGELASSIAHELSQPLTVILSTAQAAQRMLRKDALNPEVAEEALEDIISSDQRAADIIQRMRALLKKGEVRAERCDLNQIARDAARLVGNDALLRQASFELEAAADLPPVRGDAVQIQQVVLNLLSNALDAVSEQPPGQRRVTLRTARAGASVELAVEDTGRGIPEDDITRIFEPFFTTKPQGLGMGLSISSSIVKAHGGELRAERRAGGGTVVRCLLPSIAEGERNGTKKGDDLPGGR